MIWIVTVENRWPVELGQSNSSSYSFEPLDILEYLPMQVRLYVPPVADGLPAAGSTDSVTCSVTSEADPSLNISETVILTVKPLESFATNLLDDTGIDVGPASFARDVNVDTGERLNLTLLIENTGNAPLDLTVRVNPELTTWTIQVSHESDTDNREVSLQISPGQSDQVRFEILVSPVAERNDENRLVIKTSQDISNFIINETTLVVKDEIGLDISSDGLTSLSALPSGDFTYTTLMIENTGNSQIGIEWSNSLPPDGWEVGFASPPTLLGPRESSELIVGIKPPVNQAATSSAFDLGIYATINNGFETLQVSASYPVEVQSGAFCAIEYDSDAKPLLGVDRNGESSQTVTIRNIGNIPLTVDLANQIDAKNWEIELSQTSISDLDAGMSKDIDITVKTNDDTDAGIEELTFSCGESSITLEVSVKNTKSQGGLFGIVSPEIAYSIVGALILGVAIVARRIKKSAPKDYSGEELVAPDAHSVPDSGQRMQAVMDSVVGQESLASGGVSAEEIADALAQSIPSLPTPPAPTAVPMGRPPSAVPAGRPPVVVPQGRPPAPVPQSRPPAAAPVQPAAPTAPPLPPGGLPPGWTMEQWQYYGHQWLASQGQQ